MRHHSRAHNSDSDVDHGGLAKSRSQERTPHFQKVGTRLGDDENLEKIAKSNRRDEEEHHGLDGSHPKSLQSEQQEHVQTGDDDCPEQRNMEHELEGDGAAKHFGQIACPDGQLTEDPDRKSTRLNSSHGY